MASLQQKLRCTATASATSVRPASLAALPLRRRAAAQRSACLSTPRSRASAVTVRADSNRSTNSLVRTVDDMLKRYDFVSTGMGALVVTGWFWSHGQPPLEALSIAAVSTIVALVANELVFNNK